MNSPGTFSRYELIELIGDGGMGEVWRATSTGPLGVRKEVALKLVRGERGRDDLFAQMLIAEARLAVRLGGPHVVQVLELCEEGGRYGLAMELVLGRDLGKVVERCAREGIAFGIGRALTVAAGVAKGLAHAHRLAIDGRPVGLVHRDVSPHNVLVSFDGDVKLADFGIARAANVAGLTAPGTVKGKFAYMAPEQARAGPIDGRADLFALGVILWELLAGRPLFSRDSDAATMVAVLGGAISAPSSWNGAVPPAVDALVLGLLEREPERRIGTADEAVELLAAALLGIQRSTAEVDLRSFMHRLFPEGGTGAVRREPTLVRPAVAEGSRTRTVLVGAPFRRRALAASGVVVAGALAAWLGWARPRPSGAPAPAPGAIPPPVATRSPAAGELAVRPGIDARAASEGVGVVSVVVVPWAAVAVDGRGAGEAPIDLRLSPGRHLLDAEHPTLGAAAAEVTVDAGRHLVWRPALRR